MPIHYMPDGEIVVNSYDFKYGDIVVYYEGTQKIRYKGQWHQGYRTPNGKGTMYWINGKKRYEGDFCLGSLY